MPLSRDLMKKHRVMMSLSRRGVPGVIHLGRYNYTSAMPALREHSHRAVEICFLVKGCQTYCVREQPYRLTGGDVFLTFPGERHSTGRAPEEKGVLYWMILQVPSNWESFLGLPPAQSRALLETILTLRQRHFRGSWKMKEHLDMITSIYHQPRSGLNALAITNHVAAFLMEVVSSGRSTPEKLQPRPLQPVLGHIQQHLGEPLAVSHLARIAGLSVPRFKARFKLEMGMPPGEYVLRARIEEAIRRLEQPRATITEIAYDLGFSTSQYFATVFKRFTGRTPSAFRGSIRP